MELKETGQKIVGYGKPHWKMFAASFLFFTIGAAVEPVIPALFKKLIDSGFKEGLNYPLWLVPIVIIGLFLIRGAFNFAGNYSMTSSISSVVLDLRRDLMRGLLPHLPQYLKLVSSTPIRNMGTVAGNFINGSPIGDLTIMFLALGASITLLDTAGRTRELALPDLYLGYKKLAKAADEQVTEISFPAPLADDFFHFEKVSKRTHLDIASVNSAVWLRVENGVIQQARISAGGVGPVPLLLARTSEFLVGRELTAETVLAANTVMQDEISPISDVRGTADYKRLLLRQLLWAHFLEFAPELAVDELI